MMRVLNPLGAVLCACAAFSLTAKSSWFSNLSPKQALSCAVIGLLYFLFTVVMAFLAYFLEWPQRARVNLKAKVIVQASVCVVIMFLSDEFGERHPDVYIAGGLVFATFHFHLLAHSFSILEDYGLAQGLITVVVTTLFHLFKNKPAIKYFLMGFGGALIALYLCFEHASRDNNSTDSSDEDSEMGLRGINTQDAFRRSDHLTPERQSLTRRSTSESPSEAPVVGDERMPFLDEQMGGMSRIPFVDESIHHANSVDIGVDAGLPFSDVEPRFRETVDDEMDFIYKESSYRKRVDKEIDHKSSFNGDIDGEMAFFEEEPPDEEKWLMRKDRVRSYDRENGAEMRYRKLNDAKI